MTRRIRTRLLAVLATGALVLIGGPPVGAAEPPQGTPSPTPSPTPAYDATSVSLLPRDIDPEAPHSGTWFVLTVEPGEVTQATATLANPTDEALVVDLAVRGLGFDPDGVPYLEDPDVGVGAWGAFDQARVEVPPRTSVPVAFALTVPSGTPPGDHLGAAVAETRHAGADADVVQRVATRIIVTVPGDADRAFELERVRVERRPGPVPRGVVVRVTVRNTGSIRVAPTVRVAGVTASGPRAVVRNSSEQYVAEVPTGPFGGWVDLPIVADDVSGLTHRHDTGTFVMPWWLVVLLGVAGGVGIWFRRRHLPGGALSDLRADVLRLERLVLESRLQTAPDGDHVVDADPAHARRAGDPDRTYALESALKRARRAGEPVAYAQLALALHEAGRDALSYLLDALGEDNDEEDALIAAAATYGRRCLTSSRARRLPDPIRDRLEAQLAADAGAAGERRGD